MHINLLSLRLFLPIRGRAAGDAADAKMGNAVQPVKSLAVESVDHITAEKVQSRQNACDLMPSMVVRLQ
jgi:hypothetical protein